MKKTPTFLLLLAFWAVSLTAQTDNVGIGTTTPDPSAALDITSSNKGLLPPRLTTMQRLGISNPAEGLVVFDTNAGAFYFFDGAQWLSLAGGGTSAVIADADNDTKVEVERNPDEDVIRFSLGGTERWVMAGARLENRNSGNSVFIGEGTGANDNGSNHQNVAVGYQALQSNTSGSYNTAIGSLALFSNINGNFNTANGRLALFSNTTGSENTANGNFALQDNTTGSGNTATGRSALQANTTGSANTATGILTLYSNTTGNQNTAHGAQALQDNTTGNLNTANGELALSSNTSGSYNTAFGSFSLTSNTTGSYNSAFGSFAGVTADSLTKATAIGYFARVGCSNCLVLGSTNGTDTVNVGIGTATPASTLEVNGAVTATSFAGDGSALTGIDVNDADADPVNELITSATLNGNSLEITDAGGTQSVDLSSLTGGGTNAVIIDADNDTKIQVEESPDEDLIRFDLAGTERWVMTGARLENRNSGNSVFIGEGAGASDDGSDNRNVAVGYQALSSNTAGSDNTANGNSALSSNTTGTDNTAVGKSALLSNTTGNYNTAVGRSALFSNTTGVLNTSNGYLALNANTTGGLNTATGVQALNANTTGSGNTANGVQALNANTTGIDNTANGRLALVSNTTGGRNTANGNSTLASNTTGNENTANGRSALGTNTTGNFNAAFGSLADVTTGNLTKATAIGYNAKVGCNNCLVLGGIGADAVNVGIGTTTPASTLEVNGNVTATSFAGDGSALTGIDVNDADADPTNELITSAALNGNTLEITDAGGTQTVDLSGLGGAGTSAVIADSDNDTKVEVEHNPDEDLIRFSLGGTEQWVMAGSRLESRNSGNSVFIGEGAGASDDLSNNGNVAIGNQALNSSTSGSGNSAIGSYALSSNTDGYSNTAVGNSALNFNTTGSSNTANGDNALSSNTTGNGNTASGSFALQANTTGTDNAAYGAGALFSNTIGSNNTAMGSYALNSNNTGESNTGLGRSANVSMGNLTNATAIGYLAIASASNRVRIGNSTVTTIGGQVDWTFPSDARFKFNVDDSAVPGLALIEKLRPVTYQFDSRKYDEHLMQNMPDSLRQRRLGSEEDYARSSARVQAGFLAQEVEQACKELGYNFSGLHVPENETDSYSLAYGSFVPLLVKAVQEQQELIGQQQGQIRELQSQLGEMDEVKQRLARLEAAFLQPDRVTEKRNE